MTKEKLEAIARTCDRAAKALSALGRRGTLVAIEGGLVTTPEIVAELRTVAKWARKDLGE